MGFCFQDDVPDALQRGSGVISRGYLFAQNASELQLGTLDTAKEDDATASQLKVGRKGNATCRTVIFNLKPTVETGVLVHVQGNDIRWNTA